MTILPRVFRAITSALLVTQIALSAGAYSCLGWSSPEYAQDQYELIIQAKINWSSLYQTSDGDIRGYLDGYGIWLPPVISLDVKETIKGKPQNDFILTNFDPGLYFAAWVKPGEEWVLFLNIVENEPHLAICSPSMPLDEYQRWLTHTENAPECDEGDNGVRGVHLYLLDEDGQDWNEPPLPLNCRKPSSDK